MRLAVCTLPLLLASCLLPSASPRVGPAAACEAVVSDDDAGADADPCAGWRGDASVDTFCVVDGECRVCNSGGEP